MYMYMYLCALLISFLGQLHICHNACEPSPRWCGWLAWNHTWNMVN